MRIAVLVNSFPKASETFILDQITEMIERGHHVEIFARNKTDEEVVHEEIQEYNLLSSTHYPNIPQNKIRRILSAGKTFAANFPYRPRRVIESLRIGKYGRDALSLRMLHYSQSFEENDFDVLYCHFGPNGNLGSLLKQTGTNARVITVFHGYGIRLGIENGPGMYDEAFKHSDLLLANSKSTIDKLIKLGADPDSIVFHPIGVDINEFRPREDGANGYDTNKVTVTTVARLAEIKGHEYAIQAISEIIDRNIDPEIEYRIVGGGPKRSELEQLVCELNIEESVLFTGQVDRSTVQSHLKETDLFLLPSLDEGLGIVLLEAQASGIPVIATDVGGIPDAVNQNESAILVPPKKPMVLADKLEFLCNNPDQWIDMGNKGREYVKGNFNSNDLNARLERILEGKY